MQIGSPIGLLLVLTYGVLAPAGPSIGVIIDDRYTQTTLSGSSPVFVNQPSSNGTVDTHNIATIGQPSSGVILENEVT